MGLRRWRRQRSAAEAWGSCWRVQVAGRHPRLVFFGRARQSQAFAESSAPESGPGPGPPDCDSFATNADWESLSARLITVATRTGRSVTVRERLSTQYKLSCLYKGYLYKRYLCGRISSRIVVLNPSVYRPYIGTLTMPISSKISQISGVAPRHY